MLQIQHATNGMDNWLLEAGNDVIREYIQHGHLDQGRDLHLFLTLCHWFPWKQCLKRFIIFGAMWNKMYYFLLSKVIKGHRFIWINDYFKTWISLKFNFIGFFLICSFTQCVLFRYKYSEFYFTKNDMKTCNNNS